MNEKRSKNVFKYDFYAIVKYRNLEVDMATSLRWNYTHRTVSKEFRIFKSAGEETF